MRQIIIIATLLIGLQCIGQTKGNKNIVTKNLVMSNVESIILDMYAEVTIDCDEDEVLTITIDENLQSLVDTKVENATLHLSQLKWIEPSQRVKIKIGAPKLKKLEIDTHENVLLSNVNTEKLELIASIGKIIASGKVKDLHINSKNGNVDVSNLIADNAKVNITGKGKVNLYVLESLNSKIDGNGELILAHEPKYKDIKQPQTVEEKRFQPNDNLQWINLKIKNNSWNRNKFIVIGPKKNGEHFSYGFAMFPGTTKSERWSIGTKIYKDKGAGIKEYLVTVQESNRNKVLKLFKD